MRQLDLTTSHAVEILRRSVVMLSPGQPAFVREQAMQVLEALLRALSELERYKAQRGSQEPSPGLRSDQRRPSR